MKCDELKKYKAYEFGTSYVYHIEEVNAAIAELKAENAELKKKCEAEKSIGATFSKNGADLARWVEELRKEIESLKASHYAEMVDAGMRERRLQHALWLARLRSLRHFSVLAYFQTIRAKGKESNMDFDEMAYRINLACVKCRMKAEEYK